jgi:DNA-binding NarL/FixJ family response regulator
MLVSPPPAAQGSAFSTPARSGPTPPAESRGHILFADDDVMVLRATTSALSVSGFEVTPVENGPHALATLALRLPDALLLDINMPGNQNLDLVEALRCHHPALPIVILTGHPALDTAVRAVRLGVVDYLFKPHKMEQLIERLDLAVHRTRVLRSVSQAERVAHELSRRLDALKQAIGQASGAYLTPASDMADASAPLDPLRNLPRCDLAQLSTREREVLKELARGHSPQTIAKSLQLSTNTVRNHLKSIFLKLRVNSQVELLGKLATPQP